MSGVLPIPYMCQNIKIYICFHICCHFCCHICCHIRDLRQIQVLLVVPVTICFHICNVDSPADSLPHDKVTKKSKPGILVIECSTWYSITQKIRFAQWLRYSAYPLMSHALTQTILHNHQQFFLIISCFIVWESYTMVKKPEINKYMSDSFFCYYWSHLTKYIFKSFFLVEYSYSVQGVAMSQFVPDIPQLHQVIFPKTQNFYSYVTIQWW